MKKTIAPILKWLFRKIGIEINRAKNNDEDNATDIFIASKNVILQKPYRVSNKNRIFWGKNVFIGPNSFLNAMTQYPTTWTTNSEYYQESQHFDSKIIFGSNISATGGLQVSACSSVVIEDDVMFSSNILIIDNFHGYETAEIPYKYQKIQKIAPILIKRGSWIGQNVVVFGGVTIGEQCIIGANSVVTNNVPNRSIAVGAPAKVTKTWNKSRQQWSPVIDPSEKLNKYNSFG